MKLSEIFNREPKTAGPNSSNIAADTDTCDCHEVLRGDKGLPDKFNKEINAREGKSPAFNKWIWDNTIRMIGNKDDVNLSKLVPKSVPDNMKSEYFVTHLLSHGEKANALLPTNPSFKNLGLTNDEIDAYKKLKNTSQEALADYKSKLPSRDIRVDLAHCPTCQGYKDTLSSQLDEHHQARVNAAKGAKVDSKKTLFKGIIEDWKKGQPYQGVSDATKSGLYKTMDEWNAHSNLAHKKGLNNVDNSINQPIIFDDENPTEHEDGSIDREPKIEQVRKDLAGNLGTGLDVHYHGAENPFDNPEVSEHLGPKKVFETPAMYDRRMKTVVQKIMPDADESKSFYRDERGNLWGKLSLPHGDYHVHLEHPGGREPRTMNTFFVPANEVGTKNQETGTYYSPKQDKRPYSVKQTETEIDESHPEITKGSLRGGYAATLPRSHRWLFQETGVEPNVESLRQYSQDMHNYKNQNQKTPVYDKPSDQQLKDAKKDYNTSLVFALQKKYGGLGGEQSESDRQDKINTALDTLDKEHLAKRMDAIHSAYTSPNNRFRTSKKEDMSEFVFNSSKKKPCAKCGHHCAGELECKKNRDDKRRADAAEAAYND